MLLIVIPTAWLAVVVFFVVLCQMAARADAAPATVVGERSRELRRGTYATGRAPSARELRAPASHDRVTSAGGVRMAGTLPAGRLRRAAMPRRGRSSCPTGR